LKDRVNHNNILSFPNMKRLALSILVILLARQSEARLKIQRPPSLVDKFSHKGIYDSLPSLSDGIIQSSLANFGNIPYGQSYVPPASYHPYSMADFTTVRTTQRAAKGQTSLTIFRMIQTASSPPSSWLIEEIAPSSLKSVMSRGQEAASQW